MTWFFPMPSNLFPSIQASKINMKSFTQEPRIADEMAWKSEEPLPQHTEQIYLRVQELNIS